MLAWQVEVLEPMEQDLLMSWKEMMLLVPYQCLFQLLLGRSDAGGAIDATCDRLLHTCTCTLAGGMHLCGWGWSSDPLAVCTYTADNHLNTHT